MAKLIVLRVAEKNKYAAKNFFLNEDGTIGKKDYDNIKYFNVEQADVSNIQELSDLLKELSAKNDCLVIRGTPLPGIDPTSQVTKTKHDVAGTNQKAYFQPHPDGQSWVCIDVDGITTPEHIDFLTHPEKGVEYLVSLLPDYFHDVSYHYQLSNSAGVYGGGMLKAHIWFWLDHPVHDKLLRYWANETNKKVGVKLIDTSLFNDVQAHYTSSPIFKDEIPDPFLNNRSGFVEKYKYEVIFPEIVISEHHSACTAGVEPANTFEEWLKLVGDHAGGEGFHEPLLNAAWHYVLEHGEEGTDVDALVGKLKEAVNNADKSKHSSDYLSKYNDQYLKASVTSAFAKIGAKGKTGKISELGPYYPQTNIFSPDEASKQLKALTEDFFENPRDMAIKAPAGLGKTTEIILQLNKKTWWNDKKVEIYVPGHKLGDELHEKSKHVPGKKSKLPWQLKGQPSPVKSVVIRGRSFEDDQGTYCQKNLLADELSRKGFPIHPNLCKSKQYVCEYYQECRYLNQYKEEYDVRIFPHSYLGLERGFLASDFPDYVVIDESFYQSLLPSNTHPPTVSLGEVQKAEWPVEIKDALTTGWLKNKPILEALRESLGDGAAEAIEEAIESTEKKMKGSIIGLDEDSQIEAIGQLPNKNHGHKLLEILRAELGAEREYSHGVTFDSNKSVAVLHYRKPITRFEKKEDGQIIRAPVLAIDADLKVVVHKEFFPAAEFHSMDVDKNCYVTQVYSTRNNYASMTVGVDKNAEKRLHEIQLLIDRECHKRNMLVVGPQKITGNPDPKTNIPPKLKSPANCDFAHFGGIRGIDKWKMKGGIIVISRYQPPISGLEGTARALWYDSPTPLQFAAEFIEDARGYRMRSGEMVGVNVKAHPDPRIQALHELIREAESQQAIDRLRLVHNTGEPKQVFLLSNLVLDVTVDKLVSWNDLLGGGSKFTVAWGQLSGVMPLNPVWLSETFPALFKTKDVAKSEIKKLWELGGFPNNDVICFFTQLTLFDYKLKSKTSPTPEKCVSSLPPEETKAKLTKIFGKEITLFAETASPQKK